MPMIPGDSLLDDRDRLCEFSELETPPAWMRVTYPQRPGMSRGALVSIGILVVVTVTLAVFLWK